MSKQSSYFLNAADIQAAINDNVDEYASHFMYVCVSSPSIPTLGPLLNHRRFMTIYGNIFGHDTNTEYKFARKFGAFAGTTWIRHNTAIAETGEASKDPDIGFNGRTLKVVIDKGGKSLHSMIVQVDNMIAAIRYVKKKTLLAALLELEHFQGETDEVSAIFRESNAGDDESVIGLYNAREDSEEETSEDEAAIQGSGSEITQDIEKSHENADLPKTHILEIRAEAMAKEFADRICGPDFVMPEEFF